MGKYTEFAEVGKEVGGGGVRRFATLLLFLLIGLILIYGMVTTPTAAPVPDVTTPTAVPTTAAGVNITTAVDSSPAVNVAIEQAPPPPPALPDSTAVLLAADTARDARLVADNALASVNALHGRVDGLETSLATLHGRVDGLEDAPDILPTLVFFESKNTAVQQRMDLLTAALVGLFVVMVLITAVVFWTTRPPTLPTLTITRPHHAESVPELLHRADTVQHGADTVQNTTSGEPLIISGTKPTIPKRSNELTDWQRAYIQNKYNRLKTYTAVSNEIWGYHGRSTLQCIKDVVG